MKFLLNLFSQCYVLAVGIRHWLYDRGILFSTKAPVAIVSVGNITVGGSGKTPFVALLATLLQKECKLAIVSRGYRSQAERAKEAFCVRNTDHFSLWQECGDEPYWLARRFPEVSVIVGKRKVEGARLAQQQGCNLILLDDGMQHRRLRRDLEIVMIEGRDPFGGGYFLPRGRLRELPSKLACADLIVINGAITSENKERLRAFTNVPFIEGDMAITEVIDRKEKQINIEGKKIAVFCAIGSPKRFVASLTAFGAQVVATFFLPDHRPFSEKALLAFVKKAEEKEAHYLCCTEKDEVKLPFINAIEDKILIAKGEFIIRKNAEAFTEVVERMKSLAKVKQ